MSTNRKHELCGKVNAKCKQILKKLIIGPVTTLKQAYNAAIKSMINGI
jgi:hypothetical protein